MCLPVQSISLKSMPGVSSSPAKMPSSRSEHLMTISVPTFVEKAEAQIEVTSLNASDIASLKAYDPFMYYSIPAARNAAMKGKEVEPSLFHADAPSSCVSSNTEVRSRKAPKISCQVTRQRRVSTECHPDLLWGDMSRDPDFVEAMSRPSEYDYDFDDYFSSLLAKAVR
ncbi:hypothetical protein HJC23_004625 [Cyclotella cryptica]|uniref:Uncharacterized protein n=1 Tax=Cyclotella cryptica TaxID=29204 RepID=A0ABD3QES0_9STRA